MENRDVAQERIDVLLLKRAAVFKWPEGPGREAALQAIDDVIVRIEAERLPDYPPA